MGCCSHLLRSTNLRQRGEKYLHDVVSAENSTSIASISVLPDGALHLRNVKNSLRFMQITACNQTSHRSTGDGDIQHLLLYRLVLFVIGGEIDQDGALAGTVECQIRVGTCEVDKRPSFKHLA